MAISTLAYKITADTKQFTTAVGATRKELNLAKKVMQETESPADRLKTSLSGLETLYKKGLLPAKEYKLAQQKVRDELAAAGRAANTAKGNVGGLGKTFGGLPGILKGIAGPLGIATSGFAGISLVIAGIKQSLDELDKLGKTSRNLGIDDPTVLRGFQFSAQKAGLTTDEFSKSFEKMLDTIGGAQLEGPLQDKKAKALFDFLEVDLKGKGPAEQFLDISEAISKLDTQAKKTDVARFVFGRAGGKELELFGGGREQIASDLATVRRLRGDIGTKEIEKALDDAATAGLVREGVFGGITEVGTGKTAGLEGLLNRIGVSGRDVGRVVATGALSPTGAAAASKELVELMRKTEKNTRQRVEVTERSL